MSIADHVAADLARAAADNAGRTYDEAQREAALQFAADQRAAEQAAELARRES